MSVDRKWRIVRWHPGWWVAISPAGTVHGFSRQQMAIRVVDRYARLISFSRHMVICPECGSKRCPRAASRTQACTEVSLPGTAIVTATPMPAGARLFQPMPSNMLV
jgi:NADH pyrophosphatase NudC (nudix superfamily)